MKIEFKSDLNEDEWNFIDNSLEQYGSKFGIKVNYHNYNFLCKESGKIIGVLKGHFGYDEGKVIKLVVAENHRGKGIGKSLMTEAEKYLRSQNMRFMSVSTYEFQAPEFYKKLGFNIEFIRDNKNFPSMREYFFVKYLR